MASTEKRYAAERRRLIEKRARLKARKDHILNKIRKQPAVIQRAVVADLRLEIADIERAIDAIDHAENKAVPAKSPLGADIRDHKDRGKLKGFGVWRVDANDIVKAFGCLRKDTSEYIDGISLPDLFAGPFIYQDNCRCEDIEYLVMIWQDGDAYRIVPDVIIAAGGINAERAIASVPFCEALDKNKGAIQDELNRRIDGENVAMGMFRDTSLEYRAYRALHDGMIRDEAIESLDRKSLRKVKRLRRYFSVKPYERSLA